MTAAIAMKWGSVVLCAAALGVAAWAVAIDPDGALRRGWTAYGASLERKLHRQFVFRPWQPIAIAQMGALVLVAVVAPCLRAPWALWGALALAVALGPKVVLDRRLGRRIRRIDDQVEAMLVAVANALKSRPAIGDALASVVSMTAKPLRDELELTVKQIRLGSSVEQALVTMSGRVGSRKLDTALSAIAIGRQVGGNLPTILETTADAMREMSRLEGVVRTKTAQGKAQLWVLSLFPFVLMLGFNAVSPGYFEPLNSSAIGYLCASIAFALWGASIVLARKILAVDI